MSKTMTIGKLHSKTWVYILFPLLVTIIGGLAVEWLKPNVVYEGELSVPRTGAATFPKASPEQSATSRADAIRGLLMGEWVVPKDPAVFGDLKVEFCDNGTVIRTYYRTLVPDAVTQHPFAVTSDGRLQSDDADISLKLASVSKDRLFISWDGTSVIEYKRPMSIWSKVGIALVVLLVVALGGAASFSSSV